MIKFTRKKKYNILIKILYKIFSNLFFITPKYRFIIFTQLEWLFWRLSIEQINKLYQNAPPPNKLLSINFIKKYINLETKILDIGCGDGVLSSLLSDKVQSILAVDVDSAHIESNQLKYKSLKNIKFIKGKVPEFLDKNNNLFDLTICSHIIEHLENPEFFLKKISKYTKKIFIEVPDHDSTYLKIVKQEFQISPLWTDDDHIYEFSRDSIFNLFDKSGLIVTSKEYRYGNMRFICEKK